MSEPNLNYEPLKKRHKYEREGYLQNLSLRVHRALSWLQCAEYQEDLDSTLVLLSIASNAAYVTEIDDSIRSSERNALCTFLEKIVVLDSRKFLENLTWHEFLKSIRILLNKKIVYRPFWGFNNRQLNKTQWVNQLGQANATDQAALETGKTTWELSIVVSIIYTSKNQLDHGVTTCRSSVNNRGQMRDFVAIMNKFVTIVLGVVVDNQRTLWGDLYYPVVQ